MICTLRSSVAIVVAAGLVVGGCRSERSLKQKDLSSASGSDSCTPCDCCQAASSGAASSALNSAVKLPNFTKERAITENVFAGGPMSFAQLAKKADPGVVTILSRAERTTSRGQRRVISEGVGTGFIYDTAGLVLTNHHVVEGATEIHVQLANGKRLSAATKGSDRHTDIAVLELQNGQGLHALELGDSDTIEVGDWVVAIGNPFGLSHTVSAGILSGKGRTKDDVHGLDEGGYFYFLQTDAAINQGNSGGPLLNLAGKVVGINTAIRANANNIGFAIPINMVKELLPILVKEGKLTRSALGIIVQQLDEQQAARLGHSGLQGAWVVDIVPGSSADRAGIRPDDIVLEFNGKTVPEPNMLRWFASLAGVGKTVTVKIARGKRNFELKATMDPLPQDR